MTVFQQTAFTLTVIWLLVILLKFRRSTLALICGLIALGLYTLIASFYELVTPGQLGLEIPNWWLTLGWTAAGLLVTIGYSRIADRLASRLVKAPPDLTAFRTVQQSRSKLITGIIVAWILGGILEELIARGIILVSIEAALANWLPEPAAAAIAICLAAVGAGLMHFYQGPRAVLIITQISILFGVLFVVSGHNLWAVIFCHGFYDTIAFLRFAAGKSRYSDFADRKKVN